MMGRSTWFSQMVGESMWWDVQGGYFNYRVEDNFVFLMQGFKQRLLPGNLEVSIVSDDRIMASIPNREVRNKYGFFEVNVQPEVAYVTFAHPKSTSGPGETIWEFTMDDKWQFVDRPWWDMNRWLNLLSS